MTRKLLLLPAIAAALLAGCATYGYDARGGTGGDYYYGQPGSDYDYYGYPYPPDYYRGYGYPGYGVPYWGGSIGYYGYYGPSWHGGSHHHGGHGGSHDGDDDDHQAPPPSQDQQQPDRPRPPWRDLDRVRRAEATRKSPPPAEFREASAPRMRAPAPSSTTDAAPRIPRVGGRKRDAHPIPVP